MARTFQGLTVGEEPTEDGTLGVAVPGVKARGTWLTPAAGADTRGVLDGGRPSRWPRPGAGSGPNPGTCSHIWRSDRSRRSCSWGEAAGYQGCRFSGIAFTSERALPGSQRTSTRAKGWLEPSATIVHGALAELGLEDRTILWNVVPFHPAGPVPRSNRTPTAAEQKAGAESLRRLLAITRPGVVAAIGCSAAEALPPGTRYLRHPAHGGARKFRDGLVELAREHVLA